MLSPPNFSVKALAISKAIIASQTTDAAGTAQISDLSYEAATGSFVSKSTDLKDFFNVGIGFIYALTTIGSPLLIPPSIPPRIICPPFKTSG